MKTDKHGWIKVEDGLPEEDGRYIVCICEDEEWGEYVMEATFNGTHFESNGMVPIAHIVTHWQPLPQNPKNEKT